MKLRPGYLVESFDEGCDAELLDKGKIGRNKQQERVFVSVSCNVRQVREGADSFTAPQAPVLHIHACTQAGAAKPNCSLGHMLRCRHMRQPSRLIDAMQVPLGHSSTLAGPWEASLTGTPFSLWIFQICAKASVILRSRRRLTSSSSLGGGEVGAVGGVVFQDDGVGSMGGVVGWCARSGVGWVVCQEWCGWHGQVFQADPEWRGRCWVIPMAEWGADVVAAVQGRCTSVAAAERTQSWVIKAVLYSWSLGLETALRQFLLDQVFAPA